MVGVGTGSVIHSADGPLFSPPVEYHLSQVDGVDQVAAYPVGEAGSQIMVAASPCAQAHRRTR